MCPLQSDSSRTRGVFIAIEGAECTGKTTQIEMLVNALRKHGHDVRGCEFPQSVKVDDPLFGYNLNNYANSLLLAGVYFQHRERLERRLWDNESFVVSHYVPGAVARGAALGVDRDWLCQVHTGLIAPDVVIILDAAADVCAERLLRTKHGTLDRKMHGIMREEFETARTPSWSFVDSGQLSKEEVHTGVLKIAIRAITTCAEREVSHL